MTRAAPVETLVAKRGLSVFSSAGGRGLISTSGCDTVNCVAAFGAVAFPRFGLIAFSAVLEHPLTAAVHADLLRGVARRDDPDK